MAEHQAAVTINAPVRDVYQLFTHFNDFPKFMSYIKEVTYKDAQTSHWVANVVGDHQWDAVNDGWQEGRQIGWRSIDGLENSGTVTFELGGSRPNQSDRDYSLHPACGPSRSDWRETGCGKAL